MAFNPDQAYDYSQDEAEFEKEELDRMASRRENSQRETEREKAKDERK